jgi:GNAT superfamily N-acetyltransferase
MSATHVSISQLDVEFHEATPEQRIQSWRAGGISFRGPLTLDQYVERETLLDKTDLCRNNGTRYWVLTHKSTGELVASCETTLKTVVVSEPDGRIRETKGYSIASVYTREKFRRRGMAQLMLEKLKAWLDGDGGGEVSALYSDIGLVSVRTVPTLFRLKMLGILCKAWLGCLPI